MEGLVCGYDGGVFWYSWRRRFDILSWWMRFGEKSVAAVLVGGFMAGRMETGVEPDRVGEVQVGNVGTQQPLFEGSGLVRAPAPGNFATN